MELIRKLTTAIRGGTREVLELAVDANGLRIFAQEIADCEDAIRKAREDLCEVSVERIRLQREADNLAAAICRKEDQATRALQQQDEALARDAARWIARRECELNDQREKQHLLEAHEAQLKEGLRAAVRQVEDYRRELRLARATASARSATERIAGKADTIHIRVVDMKGSLDRIKERQQAFADRMAAMERIDADLSDQALEERLEALDGHQSPDSADAVLARLRRHLEESGTGAPGNTT